jgi:hypothetical protein
MGEGRRLSGLAWIALVALAVAWSSRPLSHDDLFGHLRTGEWIVEHRAVPTVDPFSFTRPGARWVTHEWGFSLLAFGGWSLGGYCGLIVLRVLLVLVIGTLVAARAAPILGRQRDASAPDAVWGVALLGLALWMLRGELILRAALVSELLLALVLLVIERLRVTPRRRLRWVLIGIFLAWGNLHSGVIFGLLVLGLHAAGVWLAAPASERWAVGRPWLLTWAAAAAVSLVNPNGWEVWLYPVRLSRILFASGIGWDLGHFAAASPFANPPFLLLLGLAGLGLLVSPRSGWRSFASVELVTCLIFLAFSLRTPRFLFSLAIVGLPVMHRLLAGIAWGLPFRRLLAVAVPTALALAALLDWARVPRQLVHPRMPAGAVHYLEVNGLGGRIFNHQNFGGYLLWRRHQPVFWDGRNDVFASLVREVETTPFPVVAARYGVDILLLTEREAADLAPLIPGDWGLVDWNDDSAIYLHREHFRAFLASHELTVIPAFGLRFDLAALARDPARATAAHRELAAVELAHPESQRALFLDGLLCLGDGDQLGARARLEAAAALGPNDLVDQALAQLSAAATH